MKKLILFIAIINCLYSLGQTKFEHKELKTDRKDIVLDFHRLENLNYVGFSIRKNWSEDTISFAKIRHYDQFLNPTKVINIFNIIQKKSLVILDSKLSDSTLIILTAYEIKERSSISYSIIEIDVENGKILEEKVVYLNNYSIIQNDVHLKSYNRTYSRGIFSENMKYVAIEYVSFSKKQNHDKNLFSKSLSVAVINIENEIKILGDLKQSDVDFDLHSYAGEIKLNNNGKYQNLFYDKYNNSEDLIYILVSENDQLSIKKNIDLGVKFKFIPIPNQKPKLLTLHYHNDNTFYLIESVLDGVNITIRKKFKLDVKIKDDYSKLEGKVNTSFDYFEIIDSPDGYHVKFLETFTRAENIQHPIFKSAKKMDYHGRGHLFFCEISNSRVSYKTFLNSSRNPEFNIFINAFYLPQINKRYQISIINNSDIPNLLYEKELITLFKRIKQDETSFLITGLNKKVTQDVVDFSFKSDYSQIEHGSTIQLNDNSVLVKTINYSNQYPNDRFKTAFIRYDLFKFK